MCYSAQTSLITFCISQLSGLLLYYTYDPPLALFLMTAGFMQLWDYLFWKNPTKNATNYWATKMAMINNHIQPIVFALALIYMRKGFQVAVWPFLGVYVLVMLAYSWNAWSKIDYTMVTPKSSPGLYWQWNYQEGYMPVYSLFMIFVCYLFYVYYPNPIRWIMIIGTLASFGLSNYKYSKYAGSGRFWCFMAAFMPLTNYLMYWILDNVKR